MNLKNILNIPFFYNLFSTFIGEDQIMRPIFINHFVRPKAVDYILDIGCGTAKILKYFPNVNYFGVDMSQSNIDYAKHTYGTRGAFFTANVYDLKTIIETSIGKPSSFDIVMVNSVLHHLSDAEAGAVFEAARIALKPGGRFVSVDGCYIDKQSVFARFLLNHDRGKYVRTVAEYTTLISKYFTGVRVTIRHDLLFIPYTMIIMECSLEPQRPSQ